MKVSDLPRTERVVRELEELGCVVTTVRYESGFHASCQQTWTTGRRSELKIVTPDGSEQLIDLRNYQHDVELADDLHSLLVRLTEER